MELKRIKQSYYGLGDGEDIDKLKKLETKLEELKGEVDIIIIKKGNELFTSSDKKIIVIEPVIPIE